MPATLLSDVPNLTIPGRTIKKLRWQKVKSNGLRGYYLRLRTPKKDEGAQ